MLVPVYATANYSPKWDRYAISNLLVAHDNAMKYRLWVSAICGYLFAAYFCQLLHAEYNNFSVRRLKYLVQVTPTLCTILLSDISSDLYSTDASLQSDPDSQSSDPDTPPQKYFTVMIERIPAHLRSADQLYKFFNGLFPDDVYTVEVALDLSELDSKCKERKVVRFRFLSAFPSPTAT